MSLTNDQEKKIEALVDRMRSEVEWCDEYYTSNPDNGTADYVASVGYGGDLMHQVEDAIFNARYKLEDQLEPDEVDYLKALVKGYHPSNPKAREIVNAISEITNLCFESSYWANDLELCSMQLGEIEHQLDDSLVDDLKQLSDEEMDQFVDDANSYASYDKGSNYIYVDHSYSRWYLELDVDKLRDLMKSKPIESFVALVAASTKKLNKFEVIK